MNDSILLFALEDEEVYQVSKEALNFFCSNKDYRTLIASELGIALDEKQFQPFTGNNFYQWIKNKGILKSSFRGTQNAIFSILNKMHNCSLFDRFSTPESMNGINHYKYFTFRERLFDKNDLCSILVYPLGVPVVRAISNRITFLVCASKNGDPVAGSGVLINDKTILTCAHNVIDIDKDSLFIEKVNRKIRPSNYMFDEKNDVAIIILMNKLRIFDHCHLVE